MAIATNDVYIKELLEQDGDVYDVRKDGTIWTQKHTNGKDSKDNVWRRLDSIRGNSKNNKSLTNYRQVTYKRKKLGVHRIIYQKFNGELDKLLEINHKDGNGENNSPNNLELVTTSENLKHKYRDLGYSAVKGHSKITEEIAEKIRKCREDGMDYKQLVDKFNVCKSTISYVVNKRTWK